MAARCFRYNSQLVLQLASERYTIAEIEKLVGRPRMMQSSIWREALAEGRVEGKAEGRLAGLRELCLDFVRHRHPEVADRAAVRVNTCEDASLLRRWALAASDPASDLVRVMGLEAPPRRGRAGSVGRNGRRK